MLDKPLTDYSDEELLEQLTALRERRAERRAAASVKKVNAAAGTTGTRKKSKPEDIDDALGQMLLGDALNAFVEEVDE